MKPRSPRTTRRNDALAAWIRQAGVSYQELAVALRHTAADQGRSDLRPDRTRIGHWVCHGEQPRPPLPRILALTLGRLCDRPLTLTDLGFPEPAAHARPQSPAAPRPYQAPTREAGDPTNRRQALALLGGATAAPLLLPGKAAADTATLYTAAATSSDDGWLSRPGWDGLG